MKIETSKVRLDAGHDYDSRHTVESTGSSSFYSVLREIEANPPAAAAPAAAGKDELSKIQLLLQQLVATILEALSGEKCRCGVDDIADLKKNLPPAGGDAAPAAPRRTSRAGEFEWRTTTTEHIEEHERTRVSAEGVVRTADGREITFDLDLDMCRDFSCTREQKDSGKVVFRDPLVINFAGKAAELTDTRFSFDLDADGSAESLSTLARGSGYLVLDANRDGSINNGSEMFGATGAHAGDGFADLARFDADRNGWIDEADPAYAALGVWFPDGRITPLKEAGIGALNLASAYSPFALKDADNVSRGQIWRTGVYLTEDGQVGSLQQIDLATRSPAAEPAAVDHSASEHGGMSA